MKSTYLRIGNYVKGIGHNIVWTIEGIENDFIFTNHNWRILTSFEAIPLTEEWLVKFGFNSDGDGGEAHINCLSDFIDSKFTIGTFVCFEDLDKNPLTFFISENYGTDDYNCSYVPKSVKYVHQLQNLYFALTGEELTLKTEL